jgi:hypothetical protein
MRGPGSFDYESKQQLGEVYKTYGIRGDAAKSMAKSKAANEYQTAVYEQLKARAKKLGKELDDAELQAAAQDYTQEFQKGNRKATVKNGKIVGDTEIGKDVAKGSGRFFGYKETGEAKIGTRIVSGAKGLASQFGGLALTAGANLVSSSMKTSAPTAQQVVKAGVGGKIEENMGLGDSMKNIYGFSGALEKGANYAASAGAALAGFGPVVAGIGAAVAGAVGVIDGWTEGVAESERQIREQRIGVALENLQNVFDRVSSGLEDVNDNIANIITENQDVIAKSTGERAFDTAGGNKGILSGITSVLGGGTYGVNVNELNTQLRKEEQQNLSSQIVPLTNVLNKYAEQVGKQAVTDVRVGGGDVNALNFEDLKKNLTDSFKNSNNEFAKKQITQIALAKNISLEQAEKEFVKVIQESFNAEKLKQVGLKAVAANERTITSMQLLSNAVSAAAFASDKFASKLETNTDLFEGRINALKIPNLADQFSSGTPDLNAFNSAISDASNGLGVFGKQFREQGNAVNLAAQTLPDILAGAVANPISGQDVSTQISDGLRNALSQRGITGAAAETVVSSVAGATSGQDYDKLLAEAGGDVGKLSQKLLSGISDPLMQAFKDISTKTNDAANQYIQGLTELANRQKQLIDSFGKLDSLQLQSQKFRAKETARAIGLPSQAEELTSYGQMTQGFRNRQQRLTGFGAGAAEDPKAIANRLRSTQEAVRAQEEKVKQTSTSSNQGADFRDAAQELTNLKSEASNLQEALKNLTDQSEKVTAAEAKLEKIRSDRDIERSFGRKLLTSNPQEQLKLAQGQQLANIAQAQGGNISNFGLEARQTLFDFLDNFGPVGKDIADKIVENTTGLGTSRKSEEQQLVQELSQIYKTQEDAQRALIENQDSLQKSYFSDLDARNEKFYSELQRFTNELLKSQMVAERGREKQKLSRIEDVQKNAKFLSDANIKTPEELKTLTNKRGQVLALAQAETKTRKSEEFVGKVANANFANIAALGSDTNAAAINSQEITTKLTEMFGDPALARSIADQFRVNLNSGIGSQQAIGLAASSVVTNQAVSDRSSRDKLRQELTSGPMGDKLIKVAQSISSGQIDEAQFTRAIDGIKELNLGVGQDLTEAASQATTRINELNASINNLGGAQQVKPQVQAATLAIGGSIFKPKGTDTVPAMLTPGEFVVNAKSAQQNLPLLRSINSGTNYLAGGGEVDPRIKQTEEALKAKADTSNLAKEDKAQGGLLRQARTATKQSNLIIDTLATEKRDEIINGVKGHYLTQSSNYISELIKNPKNFESLKDINETLKNTINADEFSNDSGKRAFYAQKRMLLTALTGVEAEEDSYALDAFRVGANAANVTGSGFGLWNKAILYISKKEFDAGYPTTKFRAYGDQANILHGAYLNELQTSSNTFETISNQRERLQDEGANLVENAKNFVQTTFQNYQNTAAKIQAEKDAKLKEQEAIDKLKKFNEVNLRGGNLQSPKDIDLRSEQLKSDIKKSYVDSGLINEDITLSGKGLDVKFKNKVQEQDKYFFQGRGSADSLAKILNLREAQAQVLIGRMLELENGKNVEDIDKIPASSLFSTGENQLNKLVQGQVTDISLKTLSNLSTDKKRIISSYISLKSFQDASLKQGKDLVDLRNKYGTALSKDPKVLTDKLIKEKEGRQDISGFKDFIIADADGKFKFLTLLNQTLQNQGSNLTNRSILKNKDKNVLDVLAAKEQKANSFVRFGRLEELEGANGLINFGGQSIKADFSEALYSSIIPSEILQPLLGGEASPTPESIEAFLEKNKNKVESFDLKTFGNAGLVWNLIAGNGKVGISRFKNLSFPDRLGIVSKKFGLNQGGMFKIESNKIQDDEGKITFERKIIEALAENDPLLAVNAAVLAHIRNRANVKANDQQNKPENELGNLVDAGIIKQEADMIPENLKKDREARGLPIKGTKGIGERFVALKDNLKKYLQNSFYLKLYKDFYKEKGKVVEAEGNDEFPVSKANLEVPGFNAGNYWLFYDPDVSNPYFDKSKIYGNVAYAISNNPNPGIEAILQQLGNPQDAELINLGIPKKWETFDNIPSKFGDQSYEFDKRDKTLLDPFNAINDRVIKFLKFKGYASNEAYYIKEGNILNTELEYIENTLASKLKSVMMISGLFNETSRSVDGIGEKNYEKFKSTWGNFSPEQQNVEIEQQNVQAASRGGLINYLAGGGVPSYRPNPDPSFFKPKGTDTVPAMLTPGEFVVRRDAAQANLPLLHAINNGSYLSNGGSVSYYATGGPASAGQIADNNLLQASYDQINKILSNVDDKSKLSKSISGISKSTSNISKVTSKLSNTLGFAYGGLVSNMQFFADGGSVDTVPAMLTPGEFVVNKKATSKHLNLLKRINNGILYRQEGGLSNSQIIYNRYLNESTDFDSERRRREWLTRMAKNSSNSKFYQNQIDALNQQNYKTKEMLRMGEDEFSIQRFYRERELEKIPVLDLNVGKKERDKIEKAAKEAREKAKEAERLGVKAKEFVPTSEQEKIFRNNPESLNPSDYIKIKRYLESKVQKKASGGLIKYLGIGGELAFTGYKTKDEIRQEQAQSLADYKLNRDLNIAGKYGISKYYFRPEDYSKDYKDLIDISTRSTGKTTAFAESMKMASTSFGSDDAASQAQASAAQAGMEGLGKSGVLSMTTGELEGRQKFISEQAAKRKQVMQETARLLGIQYQDPYEASSYAATGGIISGFGNTDSIPAMLTPGEFVINKNAVSKFGISNLNKINRYANGGFVNYLQSGGENISSGGFSFPSIDFSQFNNGINLFSEVVNSFNENNNEFVAAMSAFNNGMMENTNKLGSTFNDFVSKMNTVSTNLSAVVASIPPVFNHQHSFDGNLAVNVQANIDQAVNTLITSFQEQIEAALSQLKGSGM